MGRLKNAVIEQIKEMATVGYSAEEISKKTGVGLKSVERQLGLTLTAKVKVKVEVEDEETKEEAPDTDWNFWGPYWKQQYLDLHAEMKVNEYLNS